MPEGESPARKRPTKKKEVREKKNLLEEKQVVGH
jgi:hypothetical protein